MPDTLADRQILGDIYLTGGQYRKALATYGIIGHYAHGKKPYLLLDVALAYCGLGDYTHARLYYNNQTITDYHRGFEVTNLPGTDTLQHLYASVLLAREIAAYSHWENFNALANFSAAGKYAPRNALVQHYWAEELIREHREAEAVPHLKLAAQYARGPFAAEVKTEYESARRCSVQRSSVPPR